MSVDRICVREVDFAEPHETAWQAAERMHDRAVGTLVVQDEHGHPEEILTDPDLVERVIVPNRNPHETLLSEVMTPDPICTYQVASIESAVALMRNTGFRRLPVFNRHDKVVGILSLDDVLSLVCEKFVEIGELLKKQLPQAIVQQTG